MAVTTAVAQHEGGRHTWLLAAFGLAAFGVAIGMALAVGELAAFYVAVTLVTGIAVLFDFRIGAVLLMLVLPFGNTQFFPHNLFGLSGLNPLNLLFAATLVSFVLRNKVTGLMPQPLLWLFIVPIMLAGLMGTRSIDDIPQMLEEALGLTIVT